MKVVILDMQPIDPPIGGGRLRLLGLYSGFKNEIDATYVGSYDWRGPGYREHMLSSCLREINVPLSEEHFKAHDELAVKLGKNCIDTAFPLQGSLSEDFLQKAQEYAKSADVVVFSHPWLFPFIAPVLDKARQLVVYDSQNCEGILRVNLLDDNSRVSEEILRAAVRCEWEICHAAHLILACSQEDKQSFVNLYGIELNKISIVPNGVFVNKILPCDDMVYKEKLRKKLGILKPAACFIGSGYYPNEEAARLIIQTADMMPNHQFIFIGGVGNNLSDIDIHKHQNVTITGFVEEHEKVDYLLASDIAINPMLSGSGTNIKMFDFMAAGLPIITTPIGARGIANTGGNIYDLCEPNKEDLAKKIIKLLTDKKRYEILKKYSRIEVCEKYSWEQISYELGYRFLQNYKKEVERKNPFYSIIIPTYERHDLLIKLLDSLQTQTFQDFEVIIVDQSKEDFQAVNQYKNMDITYFKTIIKGAAKARNTGIRLAKGQIVAFIDDDCMPDKNWLNNAAKYLKSPKVVGVEGLIEADIYDRSTHRVVTNIHFEGIGYMTANLFICLDVLQQLNGFDEDFDNPHFREDTDLAWRVLRYGDIPYGKDVIVLHPSHLRDNVRESIEERNKFYIHDPLLLKKHPAKFADLFVMEQHYKEDGYWEFFKEGMHRHSVPPDLLDKLLMDERVEQKFVPKNMKR